MLPIYFCTIDPWSGSTHAVEHYFIHGITVSQIDTNSWLTVAANTRGPRIMYVLSVGVLHASGHAVDTPCQTEDVSKLRDEKRVLREENQSLKEQIQSLKEKACHPPLMKSSIFPESSSIVDVHAKYFSGRRETPYGHHTTEGEHEREGPSGGNDDHDVVVFVLCVSTEVEHSLRQYCRHHHRHGDYGGRDRIPVLHDRYHLIEDMYRTMHTEFEHSLLRVSSICLSPMWWPSCDTRSAFESVRKIIENMK